MDGTWSQQANRLLAQAGFPEAPGLVALPYGFSFLGWKIELNIGFHFMISPPGGDMGEWNRLSGTIWRLDPDDLPYVLPSIDRVPWIPVIPMNRIRAYIEYAYDPNNPFSPVYTGDGQTGIEAIMEREGYGLERSQAPYQWSCRNVWWLRYFPGAHAATLTADAGHISQLRNDPAFNPYDMWAIDPNTMGFLTEYSLLSAIAALTRMSR